MMQPPQRNLGAGEAWGRWVENVLKNFDLDKVTSNASRAVTQSATALNYTSEITNNVSDVFTLSENAIATANDAVTWSLLDPVNPPGTEESPANIPTNNSATWFTIEEDGTVLRMWQWSPLDDSGQWVQQKFGTDTISPESISAELLAQSVSDDIETAKSGAAAAQTAANEANTAAQAAQTAADNANDAAADAAGIATGKGKIIYAPSAPTGDDCNANNLWINTAGGANTPMRWDGTNWVAVSDKKAVDAAAAAANAQSKADQAFSAAQDAADVAAAAGLAANHAQTTADGKNTVYYQTAAPAGVDLNLKANDVWYDTDDGYKMYRYSGTAWVAAALGSSAIASLDAGKITTGYLGADRIAAGSITAAKLVSGTITAESGVIADLAITDAKIANGTISNAKIANLDAGKITTGTLNAARIAANSITADKLNANAFTGQTFTGSVFTAGGGSLPKVLVGPSSGIPGTGDQYGVYISTPSNNANGSASLSVAPTGPSLTFQDGSGNETFYVDGNGNIRIKNLTDGGMVDLTKLTTQRWTWTRTQNVSVAYNNTAGTISGTWSFFEAANNTNKLGTVLTVSSPTGRLRVDGGVRIAQKTGTYGNESLAVQWGVYSNNPTNFNRTDVTNSHT